MAKETTIIEIGGVKMEVDLRQAKRVDTFRVGSRVKVLIKSSYDTKVHCGVVVGFDAFTQLPTITVAYIDDTYSNASVKYVHINAHTCSSGDTRYELVIDADEAIPVSRTDVMSTFDREITKKLQEIQDIQRRRAMFVLQFGKAFNISTADAQKELAAIEADLKQQVQSIVETI